MPSQSERTPKAPKPAPTPATHPAARNEDAPHLALRRVLSASGQSISPSDVLTLQRSVGNRAVGQILQRENQGTVPLLQRTPVRQDLTRHDSRWVDPDLDDDRDYDSLSALVRANLEHYKALDNTSFMALMRVLKKELEPAELRRLMDNELKRKVVGMRAAVDVRVVQLPGIRGEEINATLAGARRILERYGLTINERERIEETEESIPTGMGLDDRGRYAREGTRRERNRFFRKYGQSHCLTLMWVSDFAGYGLFDNKPVGLTVQNERKLSNDPFKHVVLMRPGQSGTTLAHEIGHALGDGNIDHGGHVNDLRQFNLMHGSPMMGGHTHLRREQVAAFKASPYVRLEPVAEPELILL